MLKRTFCMRPNTARFLKNQKWLSTATQAQTETIQRPEPQVAESLTSIGTRRIFEFEHDQYRELCRRFYADHVIPFHSEWEKAGQVPRELWTEAAKNGLLCVTVPEVYILYFSLSIH